MQLGSEYCVGCGFSQAGLAYLEQGRDPYSKGMTRTRHVGWFIRSFLNNFSKGDADNCVMQLSNGGVSRNAQAPSEKEKQ